MLLKIHGKQWQLYHPAACSSLVIPVLAQAHPLATEATALAIAVLMALATAVEAAVAVEVAAPPAKPGD